MSERTFTPSYFGGRTVAIEVTMTYPGRDTRPGATRTSATVEVNVPIPKGASCAEVEAILAQAADDTFSQRCSYAYKRRQRVRKAWSINTAALGLDGKLIVFAPAWREARNRATRILRDNGTEFRASQLRAVRSERDDGFLPERHPLADLLTDEDMHILLHAFGLNENEPEKAGYRDHYDTKASNPKMRNLVELCLMRPKFNPNQEPHTFIEFGEDGTPERQTRIDSDIFGLTPLGINVAMSLVPLYAKGLGGNG